MGRLVTSVILIEAGKLSLQVMCIQCMERTLAHRFAKPSLPTHLMPPIRSTAPAHSTFKRLILPRAEGLKQ